MLGEAMHTQRRPRKLLSPVQLFSPLPLTTVGTECCMSLQRKRYWLDVASVCRRMLCRVFNQSGVNLLVFFNTNTLSIRVLLPRERTPSCRSFQPGPSEPCLRALIYSRLDIIAFPQRPSSASASSSSPPPSSTDHSATTLKLSHLQR
ncbi:hypothetical protein K431DRAFT_129824 [Polychaeton citri CBS 116435]|uniref:Uncharacterized protein n=1 Tax=Polychaeton citri CBS 116435 TaxID=1314669 RepID=A0A9P4Q559_9PEZI|nr:hypothetical protein K431DRAFT_129824 [Polychaeton citri CBS 116435]